MKGSVVLKTKDRILSLIESEFDSDAAFERELGLPAKTVNNWRRDRSSSFMKMLPALAESFDISVSELLDMPISGASAELTEDESRLISLYRKSSVLTAKQRIALTRSLEDIIELYIDSAPAGRKKDKD